MSENEGGWKMKGLSFNVTLSKDQMEELASMTAQKVLDTQKTRYDYEAWYKNEIEDLKNAVTNREKMIVQREIHIERYKTVLQMYKDDVAKYRAKYGELTE